MDAIRFPELPNKEVTICGMPFKVYAAGQIQLDRQTKLYKFLHDVNMTPADNPMAFVWPLLASCTEPYIDFDNYGKIPQAELNTWADVAAELNPHWFAAQDPKN
jgi:hypothetical protein